MTRSNTAKAFDIRGKRVRSYEVPEKRMLPKRRGPVDSHALFTERLSLIDEIIDAVALRSGFTDTFRDDFRSEVHERLLADDCARLRRFGGRSSWKTYLSVVITNLARDYRNKHWGKWRPSAKAKELGLQAVRLEQLVHRDGLPLRIAVEQLITENNPEFTRRDAYGIYAELPMRVRREIVGLEPIADLRAPDEADAELWNHEEDRRQAQLKELLRQTLEELDPEDCLMIRMRYFDGFTLARTGEALDLSPQRVHDRINRALGKLRDILDEDGLSKEDAAGG